MAEVILSKRLKGLTEMVTQGNRVVDVGCDHGFVSIYLIQKGISPSVLAMDVRKGPLSRAQEHVAESELSEYIETRLSDGLLEYREGEADSLICAGMGGRLMMKILTESREKARGLKELILQPQSELPAFRRFLRMEGYRLLDENIIWEEGKYYFLMKVCYEGISQTENAQTRESVDRELADSFGEILLQRRSLLLKQYFEDTLRNMRQIEASLANNENERAKERLKEVQQEIENLERARSLCGWEK